MIYAYIRVSTDRQTLENQKFEINKYCERQQVKVDRWFEDEGISGRTDYHKRNLNPLLNKLKEGDTVICSELSRLGRSLFMVFEILNMLQKKKVKLYTIKENFTMDDSITSKVISFAFGLSAELEVTILSKRVKEALALRRAMGITLGRPRGSKNKTFILDPYRDYITTKIKEGRSNNWIRKHLHCHINTLKHATTLWNLTSYPRVRSKKHDIELMLPALV